MNTIQFIAIPTEIAASYRAGEPDANGQLPERHIAQSDGVPCRHCLQMIEIGQPYLIVGHRPFPEPQPYAEVGPIFLHAEQCERGGETAEIPATMYSPSYIVRGYNAENRIIYGTGSVVSTPEVPEHATKLLERHDVSYLHVRSAANNCFTCRIERAES